MNTHTPPLLVRTSVAEPPLFWAAPAPDGQGHGADSGSDLLESAPAPVGQGPSADSSSDLLGSAPAPGKKRRLQAAPAPCTKIYPFKLSKS